jgi:uncharacterized protein YaaR (DUF327 family)
MDKIDFNAYSILNAASNPGLKAEAKKTRAKGGINGSGKTLFSKMLETAAPEAGELGPPREFPPSEEALTALMDAVHSAGSDLIDRPFHEEILRYKRAVRDFIHYVVENGYETQTVQGLKKKTVSRGETKWKDMIYHPVRVIDHKLEELAAAILSGQTTQLERVSKLDEIKGLLVDLTISGVIRGRDG